MNKLKKFRVYIIVVLSIISVQAITLYLFGQPPICTCGYIKLWEPDVMSSGNSQHLTDWYTFSHIIHGFLFFWLFSAIFRKKPLWAILLSALLLEAGWEIAENTPFVINAYREQALAQGYVGDSVINSVFDTLSALLGFIIAKKLPVKTVLGIMLVLEMVVGYLIHDNLTLNVLNFVYKNKTITEWQMSPAPLKQ